MIPLRRCSGLALALGLALGLGAAIAKGALGGGDQASKPSLTDLARTRHDAAGKLYDTAWSYYRQKVASTGHVYFASFRLLRAELDLSDKRDHDIAAYERHLCRVKKLQEMVAKVQALGRVNTLEACETSYYRSEAEYWIAQARSSTQRITPHGGIGPVASQSSLFQSWDG
jgi:hypothetical protein